jgi:hypothetical protein
VIDESKNYDIFNIGNVRNVKTGRLLKSGVNSDGYLKVGVYKDGKYKTYKIHRLIAMAFINNPENKSCVDHIDNNYWQLCKCL